MLVHEFRIVMPLTVSEYEIAMLHTIADMSKQETGGGEGIEIVKNEPFTNIPLLEGKYTSGQYTQKIYHVERKMPSLLKLIFPKGSLKIHEESWNAYPYMKTVLTNPGYMKDGFILVIESFHLLDDRGNQENILQLPANLLKKRGVTVIDIANDPVSSKDYSPSTDPSLYKSEKTGRGPLAKDWMRSVNPVMTCYKLVRVNFKWFGLQNRVENFVKSFDHRLFTVFHRRLFCSMDQWYGMTIQQIRQMEEETKAILDRERTEGAFRGASTASASPSATQLK